MMQIVDDEVRKWTEKKKRSKSAPRGSELDELMGSSKTKPRSKFAAVTATVLPALASAASGERRSVSPPPIRRHSRVELYENDRKRLKERERPTLSGSIAKMINRFSSTQFVSRNIAGSTSALDTAVSSSGEMRGTRFMDEEHEREIVEREKRSRMRGARPDIVHPIDLNTAAVEVVTIRPNAAGARNLINKRSSGSYPFGQQQQQQQSELLQLDQMVQQHQRVFEKHKTASVHKNSSTVCPKVIAAAAAAASSSSSSKARVDYTDSKDSGHETSSIHTENSDSASNSSNDGGGGGGGRGNHNANAAHHSRTSSGSENGYASTVSDSRKAKFFPANGCKCVRAGAQSQTELRQAFSHPSFHLLREAFLFIIFIPERRASNRDRKDMPPHVSE